MSARGEWAKFLKANGHDLAGLTGQDSRALAAAAALWTLYSVSDTPGRVAAREAIRALVGAPTTAGTRGRFPSMQPKYIPLVRELIAFAMDWTDREKIWPQIVGPAGLDPRGPDAPEEPS